MQMCIVNLSTHIKCPCVSYEDKSSRSKNGKHRYFEKLNEKLSLVLVHSIISMTIYKRINKKKEVK